jgi:hypothetical protein
MFPYRTYLYCPEYPRQKQWPRWRGIATEDDGGVPALPEEDLGYYQQHRCRPGLKPGQTEPFLVRHQFDMIYSF